MEAGKAVFSWRGFEKRSHAAEHVISFPFFPKKHQQFSRTPQTLEKVSTTSNTKNPTWTPIQNSGGKCPSRAADYTLARAFLELGQTRKDRTDRSTSMSAQLIRKVIRILEALISIILMLLHGKLVLFFHRQLREDKHGICGLLGIIGVRVGGGKVIVGQFDIWSH